MPTDHITANRHPFLLGFIRRASAERLNKMYTIDTYSKSTGKWLTLHSASTRKDADRWIDAHRNPQWRYRLQWQGLTGAIKTHVSNY